jgi:membrane associated rhomboid family serine protease
MLINENSSAEKRKIFHALFVPSIITLLIFLSFVFERGMGLNFYKAGIYPRNIENLWGVFTYVFVHASWAHLFNNIISFFALSVSLYYFYNLIAGKILLYSYLSSGVLLWLVGRESWHIGASGLVYALVFFLFFSGLIRKHVPLISISLVVVFLYGSMFWHLFPWQTNDPVSWEGHLSGGLSGLILAVVFRNEGPQKPEKVWDEETDDNDDNEFDEQIYNIDELNINERNERNERNE